MQVFCTILTCVSCVTHQEVLLTKHLPSNIVEGLSAQPATCMCTHTPEGKDYSKCHHTSQREEKHQSLSVTESQQEGQS